MQDDLPDPDDRALPPRVRAMRDRFRAETPAGYRPLLHLATPFAVGGATIAGCLTCLEGPALSDLAVVPVTWLTAIAAEWRLHRDVLHKRRPPLQYAYEAHTVWHHAMYVEGAMEMASLRELRSILFPQWAVLVLVAGLVPLAWLLGQLLGHDAGLLFMATATAYFCTYEALHLAFHLPRAHPLRRLPLLERLSRNHTLHHDPRRMQRYHFGVTTGLWDRVRGTIARD